MFVFYRSPASAKSFNATTSAKPSQPPTVAAKHHPHLPGRFSSMRVAFFYPVVLRLFGDLFNLKPQPLNKNNSNSFPKLTKISKLGLSA